MWRWILCNRWSLAVALVLVALLTVVGTIAAQPPVPHAVMVGDDCLSCHQAGVAGAPRVAWDHLGRSNEDCAYCHEASGAPAIEIPHPVVGREDCLSCHREGTGSTPPLVGNHVDYVNDECGLCHFLSPAAAAPTPVPTPMPPSPGTGSEGASSCVSCHQFIFADEQHALFTGQPMGEAQAGAELFAELCAGCHGEDGGTPIGDEGVAINAEAYWSTHDDAAILQDIGGGSHGTMTAFAENYGGPLAWEEILSLVAFVRSWGAAAVPLPVEMPTYAAAIGPLLTERCGTCHGGAAGLIVTDYASLMTGSSSGPVVVPDDPDGSLLVEVQRGEHYTLLSAAELELVIGWIAEGVPER